MEKDGMATYTDDVAHTPLNFKTMFKKQAYTKENLRNHFKKWWWVHLFLFACGVLLIALPLVYVGYPNIAQGVVNGANIHLVSQSFFGPTLSTIGLYLKANVTVHSIFHARLDEWNATLYNEGSDVPLLSFPIPAFKSVTGTTLEVITNTSILNSAGFANFTKAGFQNSEIKVVLKGRGGLKLGALPHIYVNYNKVVTIPGLNGLNQLETTDLVLQTSGDISQVNTVGKVTINNPSPLNLQLGDTSFNVTLTGNASETIGNATIPNLTLAPGNNTYPLNLYAVLQNVLGLVGTPQYGCGVLPVSIQGTGVMYNGIEIPYWTTAFQAASISTTVNVSDTFINAGLGSQLSGTCS